MSQGRNRYVFLDGIRGVAALFIVLRHTSPYWAGITFFRSYLAVDLFFLLSGFVIAHAYERKLESGSMSAGGFVLVRLIRLYPVYLLSLVLCAGIALFDVSNGTSTAFANSHEVITSALRSLAYLPSHASGSNSLYPLNGVYWSLAFELVANAVYIIVRPILSTRFLLSIIAASAAALVLFCRHFGGLDVGYDWSSGGIIHSMAAAGITRAIFGIFLGVLIYRHRDVLKESKQAYAWTALFAVMALLATASAHYPADYFIDLAAAFVLFPIVVLVASAAPVPRYSAVLLMLGSASYPLYALHYGIGALIERIAGGAIVRYAPLTGIVLMILLVGVSYYIETRVDTPFRKWLSGLNGKSRVALAPHPY